MHSVQHLAPVHARGSVMSTYVTLCYVALSVPVIIAGFAAEVFDLSTVTAWYVAALVILSAVALAFLRRAHRTGTLSALADERQLAGKRANRPPRRVTFADPRQVRRRRARNDSPFVP